MYHHQRGTPKKGVTLDVVARQEPATDAAALQRIVQAAGKQLVLMTVADETGVEVDGANHQRPHVFDKVLGYATATQECLGNLAVRLVDGVDADSGTDAMVNGV
jgi:hypothetical protein